MAVPTTRAISDLDEITRCLYDFSGRLSDDFGVEPKQNKFHRAFRGVHSQYWLTVNTGGPWTGITLFGPAFKKSTRLLEVTVHTPNTGAERSAARLVEIDGVVELLHDGRVSKRDDRPRPNFGDSIELGGRSFYRLGALSGASLFENLIIFHENRFSPLARKLKGAYGGDHGPVQGYERSAAIISARHSPLCKAFLSEIGSFEQLAAPAVRPDLFFERDRKKYLIEAKPDSGFHSIVTAIGQIIVYSKSCKPDVRIILTPKISEDVLRTRSVGDVMAEHEISHIEFEILDDRYVFNGLQEVGLGERRANG